MYIYNFPSLNSLKLKYSWFWTYFFAAIQRRVQELFLNYRSHRPKHGFRPLSRDILQAQTMMMLQNKKNYILCLHFRKFMSNVYRERTHRVMFIPPRTMTFIRSHRLHHNACFCLERTQTVQFSKANSTTYFSINPNLWSWYENSYSIDSKNCLLKLRNSHIGSKLA